MASEPKTPGRVAWEAYRSALIRTPADFRAVGEAYSSPAWEAAAQAVRKQVKVEQKESNDAFRKLKHLFHPTPIEALIEIQELIVKFHTLPVPADRDHNEEDKDDLINAIATVLGEPRPVSAEECAETAGAEPSKSPPPAER